MNSHYHNDHIRGNQVFSEAIVVSTLHTKELIATKGKAELEADRIKASDQVLAMKTLAQSEDTKIQRMATLFLPYWQGILASLPELRLRLPELTFVDQLTFHGREHTAQLIEVGRSHTENDCILFLPQEKVMFCGDLLFVRCHPYLGDGDPEDWLSALDQLEGLGAEIYLPGHGPIGKKDDLGNMQLYIRMLMRQVQEAMSHGYIIDDVVKEPVPEPFTSWILAQPFYEGNLRFLWDRFVRKRER